MRVVLPLALRFTSCVAVLAHECQRLLNFPPDLDAVAKYPAYLRSKCRLPGRRIKGYFIHRGMPGQWERAALNVRLDTQGPQT